jgi:hypothetical protein
LRNSSLVEGLARKRSRDNGTDITAIEEDLEKKVNMLIIGDSENQINSKE